MKHGATVDLSVIIVSFNSARDLPACFEAMSRNTNGVDYEVIVVDNASADGTVQIVRERFPHVRVMANPENLGFARAANMGAAESRLARERPASVRSPRRCLAT